MPIPASRGSQLVRDINQALQAAARYVSRDEFWFRRFLAEAEKLKGAAPHEAQNVLAQLYGLAGDAEEAEKHIDAAIRMKYNAAYVCNKAGILSNLGYFKKSVPSFLESIDPRNGIFTTRWELGLCLGCMHELAKFVEDAQRMNLEHMDSVDVRLIADVVGLMDEISLTDEKLTQALDIAGELLRENRIFFVGNGPAIDVWKADALEKHLAYIFKLSISANEAIVLDEELGFRLFERCPELPLELMIHFESVSLSAHERLPSRPALAG